MRRGDDPRNSGRFSAKLNSDVDADVLVRLSNDDAAGDVPSYFTRGQAAAARAIFDAVWETPHRVSQGDRGRVELDFIDYGDAASEFHPVHRVTLLPDGSLHAVERNAVRGPEDLVPTTSADWHSATNDYAGQMVFAAVSRRVEDLPDNPTVDDYHRKATQLQAAGRLNRSLDTEAIAVLACHEGLDFSDTEDENTAFLEVARQAEERYEGHFSSVADFGRRSGRRDHLERPGGMSWAAYGQARLDGDHFAVDGFYFTR